MKYIDNSPKKVYNPKPGDFIYAGCELRVITMTDNTYKPLFVTGPNAFKSYGSCDSSIESLINWYKAQYKDFEFISGEDMTLMRGVK